jgi:hypothetical protein
MDVTLKKLGASQPDVTGLEDFQLAVTGTLKGKS